MKQNLLLVAAIIVSGCSNGLTYSGYQVRPVSLLTAADCTPVGAVSEAAHTRTSAVRDASILTANARNKASEIGGNAVVLSIVSSTKGASTYQTNSYRCPSTFSAQ